MFTPPPVSSDNGSFQDHGCSHPVCFDNGPFQDHGCSQPVCSDNGPQDYGGVLPVCYNNGPFQDHGGSQPVFSDNGPFQGHHVSTGPIIIPIQKKDKTHRPISLLPVISKVMERLVLGFRSGVGTIDAMATLVHRAAPITTFRSGSKTRSATIFLDFEKAFELVSREVLLESAAQLGIRGRLLLWLDDYLTSRIGTVHFQGNTSNVNHLTNGTPQGSSLSPLLFNMVIN